MKIEKQTIWLVVNSEIQSLAKSIEKNEVINPSKTNKQKVVFANKVLKILLNELKND